MPPRGKGGSPSRPPRRPTTPESSSSNAGDLEATPRSRRHPDPATPEAHATAVPRPRSSTPTIRETTPETSALRLSAFARYDEALESSLGELLRMHLPPPPLFSPPKTAEPNEKEREGEGKSESKRETEEKTKNKSKKKKKKKESKNAGGETKSMSHTEMSLAEEDVLEWIVYAPSLLDNLVSYTEQRIQELRIDFTKRLDHDFAVAVLPWHSSVGLTPVAFTEKDIEDWVYRILLCPALFIVMALRDGVLPFLHHGLDPAAPPLTEEERGPFISSSSPAVKSIPDAAIFDVKKKLKGVAEVKTEPALLNTRDGRNILADILRTHVDEQGGQHPGRRVRFKWPGIADTKSAADKQTRILCQIFTQLVEHRCDLGMLSSYVQSCFYYREGQTLYMSPWRGYTEGVLIRVVAWMALALGVPGFDRTMLVKPNDHYVWDEDMIHTYNDSGVVRQTLPRTVQVQPSRPVQPSQPPTRHSTRVKKPFSHGK